MQAQNHSPFHATRRWLRAAPALLLCASLLGGCALPPLENRTESHALTPEKAASTDLGRAVAPELAAHAGLAGIYPLQLFPKIHMTIQPRRKIPMPQLPSAKLRRRRAGELMRHILLDMLVTTRPRRTLYRAFLDARATFGSGYRLVEDIRLQEESYGSLLRMALGLGRLLASCTAPPF